MSALRRVARSLPLAFAGIGLLLIGAAAAFVLLNSSAAGDEPEDCAQAVPVSSPAPPLQLTDLQGASVGRADYAGSWLLLNMWATWCPPCRNEIPALESFYRRHRQEGLTILGVNIGEEAAIVQRFVARSGITFPVWLDPDEESLRAFGTISLPSSFLIDPQGTVRLRWIGGTCERELEQVLTPLLRP